MNDPTFNEAKQFYLEQYASAIVTGGYLKVAVAFLSLVVFGLVLMNLKVVRTLERFKPLVIRIDEIGRAQAVAYDSLAYKPAYPETKYFLTRFCQLYYRRNRSTINDDFSQAMYFLDGKLAGDTIQEFKQKNIIKSFLSDGIAPERDIDVQQVVVEPMVKPPYKATVDFFEIEYSPADHSVAKKTLYTASFLFTFREQVPNQDILVNPLGLAITYFREDEAFLK
ncbi:MAG: VirB8/TrbF family protein [Candidatus Acidiferrales bacterium]